MMKAESNSLLYIIISVVLLIVSAIRKNKNKNQSAPQPSSEEIPNPQAPWQRELENVFGKIIGEEPENEKTYPQKELLNTEREPVKTLKFEMSPIQSNFQDIASKPFQDLSVNSVSNLHSEGFSRGIIELDENEIRKAIIYSEIINRKYF